MGTKIEWTKETWNPIIGCSKISPGCDHCYAERMARRLASMPMKHNGYVASVKWEAGKALPQWNGTTHLVESALKKPLHWKKPRTIFVCSMGDLFHSTVPFEWISKVFAITQKYPQHTFLILTKRPATMWRYFLHIGITKPYLNVWLGVTTENQEQADKRIPILLQIPVAKRFVSIEPMLGPIDLQKRIIVTGAGMKILNSFIWIEKLDWVICGSESGPGRRECNEDWVRSLRDQCEAADTPFFLKQLHRNGKKVALPELDSKTWNQKPKRWKE